MYSKSPKEKTQCMSQLQLKGQELLSMRLSVGGGRSHCCVSPKPSLKTHVDNSNHSTVLWFWRPNSETRFRGDKRFPAAHCIVQGEGSGSAKCSVKPLVWVCEGGDC